MRSRKRPQQLLHLCTEKSRTRNLLEGGDQNLLHSALADELDLLLATIDNWEEDVVGLHPPKPALLGLRINILSCHVGTAVQSGLLGLLRKLSSYHRSFTKAFISKYQPIVKPNPPENLQGMKFLPNTLTMEISTPTRNQILLEQMVNHGTSIRLTRVS